MDTGEISLIRNSIISHSTDKKTINDRIKLIKSSVNGELMVKYWETYKNDKQEDENFVILSTE